jgi:hypothetical protein
MSKYTPDAAARAAAEERRTGLNADLNTSLAALAEEMAAGKSDRLVSFLDFAARFHKYSFRNCILIALQCPHATQVASYRAWQEAGYQVARGQKALRILAPIVLKSGTVDPETGEESKRLAFRDVAVFDASQLDDSKPLPEYWTPLGDDAQEQVDVTLAALAKDGARVSEGPMPGAARGYATRDGRIVTAEGLGSHDRLLVLWHEWAHRLLHFEAGEAATAREVAEWHAEATAYVVARHYGIANPFAADYLLSWHGTPDTLRGELASIAKAAAHIINACTPAADATEDVAA